MNYEVARKLANLGKQIPREWLKQGVKEIDHGKDQREKIDKIVRTGYVEGRSKTNPTIRTRSRVDRKTQQMLYNNLERGRFNNVKREVDEKVNDKISKAWDQIIVNARRRGELPSEREAQVDYKRFMASRRKT